ncbi:MAG: hypothetical protein K2N22_06805 [Clostridia bacterium]|nr:hypothetical protein [Clostridia bacterium]
MKKLLSIVVYGQSDGEKTDTIYDQIELIYADGGLQSAIKQAKGKYILIEDRTFLFNDVQPFMEALDTATQDIIRFNGRNAYKSHLFKGVADKDDCFAFCTFAAFNAKTVGYFEYAPFTFSAADWNYDKEENHLLQVCGEFKRVKAKLSKEVYSFTFDLICDKLLLFYLHALLAVRAKTVSAEQLSEFDKNLKDEIVLYLALDKRFDGGKLSKIRKKGFKISYFTARRYKKLLKN